jgi:alkaline phosphatase D
VTPAKSKVAETIQEFRGNYEYNMSDACVQRFNAEVAQYVLWDDHEVTNNWYPGRMLEDERYTVRSASLLAARARRAMLDCTPIRADVTERIFRQFSRGPLLDVFCLDMRSYRGTNNANMQTEMNAESRILGAEQLRWLKRSLNRSRAVWKVIAADMPLGLLVPHDATRQAWEAVAQGDPGGVKGARGRELEIADLLSYVKREEIANVVWVTADVHYCATHHYHPDRAAFQEFTPFYEFVSGPLHAGGFGPNDLDGTFGPQVLFSKHPGSGRSNTNPAEGLLFFGHVRIRGATKEMTVAHYDVGGTKLSEITLAPA